MECDCKRTGGTGSPTNDRQRYCTNDVRRRYGRWTKAESGSCDLSVHVAVAVSERVSMGLHTSHSLWRTRLWPWLYMTMLAQQPLKCLQEPHTDSCMETVAVQIPSQVMWLDSGRNPVKSSVEISQPFTLTMPKPPLAPDPSPP